ncbi:MAG TPA: ester cyclase [Candidatus Limnocylindrales bacterium]
MSRDDVLALARAYFDAINRHDFEQVSASLAPTYVHHSGAGDLDPEAFLAQAAKYVASFPDFRYDVVEILPLADGHSVVARWTMLGTQLGVAFGAAPSGKPFRSPGMSLHRFEDGHLIEDWEYGDDIAMFEDLGFHLEPPRG